MEPHEAQGNTIQIRLSKKLLIVGTIIPVIIGSAVGAWYAITGSPQYSLFRLKQAMEHRDEIAVEHYLDRESIANDAVNYLWGKFEAQVAEEAFKSSSTSSGWEALGAAMGMQVLQSIEPSIKSLAISKVTQGIDEAILGSESSTRDSENDAALTSIKLVEVRQSGNTALAVLDNPKAQTPRVELVMERNPDRTWKITRIAHKTLDGLVPVQDVLKSSAAKTLGEGSSTEQSMLLPEPSTETEVASPEPVSEFQFPQASCGDGTEGPTASWYPVFIDGGDLDHIRSQYCGDAISTTRKNTGNPTVQVASFTDFDEASKFAATVGGEVGEASHSSTSDVPATP